MNIEPFVKSFCPLVVSCNISVIREILFLKIPLPPLTEERRVELGKVVHNEGENAKIAIRNIRRDANHHLKELLKDKEISEDEERRTESEIQQITDEAVNKVDEIVAEKEKDLMEI